MTIVHLVLWYVPRSTDVDMFYRAVDHDLPSRGSYSTGLLNIWFRTVYHVLVYHVIVGIDLFYWFVGHELPGPGLYPTGSWDHELLGRGPCVTKT